MVSVVATGREAEEKLKARGVTPGKQTSKVSYRSGGRVQKEVFFEGGEAVRTENYDYEKGVINVEEKREEYQEAAYYQGKPYSKEQYETAKEKVLSDLAESNRRIEEEKKARFEQQLRIMQTGVANPTTAGVVSLASKRNMDSRGVYNPSYTQINREVNYFTLMGERPGLSYFEQDKERKMFFIRNNPTYFSSEEQKRVFLSTNNDYEKKNVIDFLKGRRENVKNIEAEGYTREELRMATRLEAQENNKNIFEQLRQFKQLGVEYIKPLKKDELVLVTTGIEGTGLPNIYVPKDDRSFKELSKDLPLAKGGAEMVAYTAASIPANAINPLLTQTFDFGLAAPTYVKSIYNPTPKNRADRRTELWDVAVDFVPEAAGVIIGASKGASAGGLKGAAAGAAAGFSLGRRIPTPNIDVNINNNIKAQSNFNGPEIEPGSGSYSYGNAEISFNEEIYGEISGSTTRLINTVGGFVADFPGVNINNRYQGEIGVGNNNIFANENINVNENLNINENLNENLNININENANVNENININENVNENININENINANLAYNLNFNSFGRREKQPFYTPTIGGYQAFTKVQGVFTKIGPVSSSPQQALKFGEQFVEGTAARTLGVTASKGKIKGLDLGNNPLFKKKDTRQGTIYIEPLARAINTPGELAQIRGKRGKKIKFRRLKI